jgi:GTP cyclohydrolase FolE2
MGTRHSLLHLLKRPLEQLAFEEAHEPLTVLRDATRRLRWRLLEQVRAEPRSEARAMQRARERMQSSFIVVDALVICSRLCVVVLDRTGKFA